MKRILISIFLCFISFSIYSQQDANQYFSSGTKKYISGDIRGAIDDLQKCLEIDPTHKNAKNLLGLTLTELVTVYYEQKKYVEAFPFLEALLKLFPEDEKVILLYNNTKKRIEQKLKRSLDIPLKQEEIETLFALLDRPIFEQEAMLSTYSDQQRKIMEAILTQARKSRDDLIIKFKQKEETTLKMLVKTYIFTAAGIVVFITIVILILIFYIHKRDQKREMMMLNSYEKIFDKLQPFITGSSERVYKPDQMSEMLKNVPSQGKLRGVEVIEAELVNTDKEIGERLLKPFLEDSDKEVKMRAIKALYKYNPAKALKDLFSMCKDADVNTRLIAVKMLAQMYTEDSARLLLVMRNDKDEKVQREVLKGLYSIYETKKANLPKYMWEIIEKFFDEVKDQWVFK